MSGVGRAAQVRDRAGTLVAGRYRVKDLLGVGAMGSVWTAEHLALKRQVVAKFHEHAFTGRAGEVALARFLREVKLLAAVQHRNVIAHYESAQTASGEPVLIMELLKGESLADRALRAPELYARQAVDIAAQIADGLEVVHAAGVIHRDVKPENIFLHEDEEGEVVPKLLDFGLARRETAGASVTVEGAAVGTPGFMAPEQARGRKDMDGRVDIHALGVTLYELLTGVLPWVGSTGMELLMATVSTPPEPITAHRDDLSGELAAVVMRAIEPDPDHRYASARDFALALRAALDGRGSGLRAAARAPLRARAKTTDPERIKRNPRALETEPTIPAHAVPPVPRRAAPPPIPTDARRPARGPNADTEPPEGES